MDYNINEEVWKDVEGYNGDYQISNLGNVKSFKYKKPRILKPHYDKRGYARLILRKDNNDFGHYIHRLVAQAFIPNPNNYPEVNHKDENPRNNTISNLEWCTKKYNNNYGTKIERTKANTNYLEIADKNSIPVLQYDLQGNFIKKWKSANECKRTLGYDNSFIAKCCRGEMYTAYKHIWKYEDTRVL